MASRWLSKSSASSTALTASAYADTAFSAASRAATASASTCAASAAFSASLATRVVRSSRADRKSTRLNSSHVANSYPVFCLKKKTRARAHDHKRTRTAVDRARPISDASLQGFRTAGLRTLDAQLQSYPSSQQLARLTGPGAE